MTCECGSPDCGWTVGLNIARVAVAEMMAAGYSPADVVTILDTYSDGVAEEFAVAKT